MRKLSFFPAFALVFGLACGVFAQTHIGVISIDGVTNSAPAMFDPQHELLAGNTHAVSIRYNLSASSDAGFWIGSNAWEVYSPDGANWVNLSRADGPLVTALSPTVVKFRKFFTSSNNGVSFTSTAMGGQTQPGGSTGANSRVAASFATVDASGLGGYTGGSNGIAQVFTFSSRLVDSNKTICFDSLNGKGTVAWEWAAPVVGSDFPQWDNGLGFSAPRCWLIRVLCCMGPVFNAPNPANVSFNHCGEASYHANAIDPQDAIPVTYALVSGPGTVNATTGVWTWSGPTVPQQGADVVVMSATNAYGAVSALPLTINVTTTNHVPSIVCPEGIKTVGVGTTKTQVVTATDADVCDTKTVTVLPGIGYNVLETSVTHLTGNQYEISYTPAPPARLVEMNIQVSDGVATATCQLKWNLICCSSDQIEIEKVEDQIQGQYTDVFIKLHQFDVTQGLGGFDFLVAYDASALCFQLATEGEIYDECNWEYFTYRFGPNGNCGNACPSGLLRIVGMAETNNGAAHPGCAPAFFGEVPVILANMRFLVTNDRTLECQYVPIRFFWYDCGDNVLSNADGTESYLSQKVFEFTELGEPFLGGEMSDPTVGFPTFQGAQTECFFEQNVKVAKPTVDFQNGGIDIICADSIDAPGDINLNGIKYEIADAVMFTNYFVSGLGAFAPHIDGSVAASDTNKDGITLTVADLVYLIRVIVGDALPYDKLSPVAARVTVSSEGIFASNQALGAAHVVIAGNVTPTLLAEGMVMEYGFDGQNTNVLIHQDFNVKGVGLSFSGDFLRADGQVVSSEFATFNGQPVVANLMPADFELHQNYPNPFNPITTIKVEIPVKGAEWKLNVYNVTGQLVQSFNGVSSTGFEEVTWDASGVSSGVYFYKLTSGDFSATKKAVLLK
jgi:hypothetical protein